MASAVVMMIGGAVTNALAFTGGNYLFSHMGSNADEERKINDLKGEEIKGSFYEQELQITEF